MSMYQVLVFKKNAVQNWPTKHVLPQDMQAISDCIYNFFRKLAEFVYVCVYVGLPNNKITYWNFKFLLVNYLKLSIPCTQSLPACEKLLKRKPIDYVHFTVCESGPQTHRYLVESTQIIFKHQIIIMEVLQTKFVFNNVLIISSKNFQVSISDADL